MVHSLFSRLSIQQKPTKVDNLSPDGTVKPIETVYDIKHAKSQRRLRRPIRQWKLLKSCSRSLRNPKANDLK
uniref:Uncharacterized protein n=1 Tax=Panagrellus redivivus TaxID=6233 RepID=A0A7E4UM19_PANRE